MIRLRPPLPLSPQNVESSRRNQNRVLTGDRNNRASTQQRQSSSRQLKSISVRRRDGQRKIDSHHDVIANNSDRSSVRKSSLRGSKQSNEQTDQSMKRNYRYRRRNSSQRFHDDNSSESSRRDNQQKRRRKGGSYSYVNNTQSLFIALIRLGIVSALAYFILINVVSIMRHICAFLFGFLQSSSRKSTSSYHLDNAYVQNIEEVRHVLELARTEFDILQGSEEESQLHSVRGEEKGGYFEQLAHPGDKSVKLSVPKFYASVSIGENGSFNIGGETMFRQLTSGKLFTPELVNMIGGGPSETDPIAPSGRTIFASIISFENSHCHKTVTNLLKSATNPGRIRVAVVDRTNTLSKRYVACDAPPIPCSSDPGQILCIYNANVDVYELKPELDAGSVFARHIGQRMYRGEYYALQVGIDSDIVFSDGWDEELIRQFEATTNEMAVISSYLSEKLDGNRAISAAPERYTICHAAYKGDGRERRLEHIRSEQVHQTAPPDRTQSPMLQPFWSSELSFSRGHFVLQVPYDPKICGLDEQDEEISMALRAFSSGYDFYTPTQSVVFRTKVDSKSHSNVIGSCKGNSKKKSRKRLYSLIGLDNNDEDVIPHEYGLGAVRDIVKFFTLYGIHASERVTEHRLCEFVTTGNMHDEFVPYMRHDGMGIDYNRVSFRFHELISIHKDSHQ